MTEDTADRFSVGERVSQRSTGECGVVVATWPSEELGGDVDDCYVAFYGDEFPQPGTKPLRRPYVLRYAAASLRRA